MGNFMGRKKQIERDDINIKRKRVWEVFTFFKYPGRVYGESGIRCVYDGTDQWDGSDDGSGGTDCF